MPRDILSQTNEESLALRALEILRRRSILAAVVFTAVAASALSFALYLPDLFRATATVLVERQVSESFVRPAVSAELESRLHVIKQEILSRDHLTELINRFDLYPELRHRGAADEALDQTRRDIQIELTGPEQLSGRVKTVAFRLSYTGRSRDRVADVTNAIAAFYVSQNDRIRSQEATQTTEFLKAQLKEAKKQLEQQEQSMRAYTAGHSGELPQQVEVNLATLERLNTQLRLNGERQIRTLEQRQKLTPGVPDEIPTARVVEPQDPNARLELKKHDLQRLEAQVTDKHPDVLRLKAEIAALEREGAEQRLADAREKPDEAPKTPPQVRRAALDSLDAELEKLKKEELDLRSTIAGVEKRLEAVPQRQQEFALITRDHQAAKELYDSLLKRYDEAQLAESVETDRQGERFRILEQAAAPEGPTAPNRPRLLFMGLILAAAAAAFCLFAAEQFDTSFHSVDELRQFTKVPVLVTIPRLPLGLGRRILRTALATASVVAIVWLVAVLSAYVARGNEELVRMLVRGGA